MGLSKQKGNMYTWVSHMHTPLRGECPHNCPYCYVQRGPGGRFGTYKGPLTMDWSEANISYGRGKVIFIGHMTDLFAAKVPSGWILSVLQNCDRYPENEYVFQTKNPGRYREFLWVMPKKVTFGCTIETDNADLLKSMGCTAPAPEHRAESMAAIRRQGEVKTFLTIEPVMAFNLGRLASMIYTACPDFVNIGADSKGTDLPEPKIEEVRALIESLQTNGIEVREKSNLERLERKGGVS